MMPYKLLLVALLSVVVVRVSSGPIPEVIPEEKYVDEDEDEPSSSTAHPPTLMSKKKTLGTHRANTIKLGGHVDILGSHSGHGTTIQLHRSNNQTQGHADSHAAGHSNGHGAGHNNSNSHAAGHSNGHGAGHSNSNGHQYGHGLTSSSHHTTAHLPSPPLHQDPDSTEVLSSAKLSKVSKLATRPTTTTPPPPEPEITQPHKKPKSHVPPTLPKHPPEDDDEDEDEEEDPIAMLMQLLEEKGPMAMIGGGFALILASSVGYSTKIINMLKNPAQVSNVSDTFKKMGGPDGKPGGGIPGKLLSSLTKKGGAKKEIFNTLKKLLDDPKSKGGVATAKKENLTHKVNIEDDDGEYANQGGKRKKEINLKSKRDARKYDDESEDEKDQKKYKNTSKKGKERYEEESSEEDCKKKSKRQITVEDSAEEDNRKKKSNRGNCKNSDNEDAKKKSRRKIFSEESDEEDCKKKSKHNDSDSNSKKKAQRKKSDDSATSSEPPVPKPRGKKSKIEVSSDSDDQFELKSLPNVKAKGTGKSGRIDACNYDDDRNMSIRSGQKRTPSMTSSQIFYSAQPGRLIPGYAQDVSRMTSPVPQVPQLVANLPVHPGFQTYPLHQVHTQGPNPTQAQFQTIPQIHGENVQPNPGFAHHLQNSAMQTPIMPARYSGIGLRHDQNPQNYPIHATPSVVNAPTFQNSAHTVTENQPLQNSAAPYQAQDSFEGPPPVFQNYPIQNFTQRQDQLQYAPKLPPPSVMAVPQCKISLQAANLQFIPSRALASPMPQQNVPNFQNGDPVADLDRILESLGDGYKGRRNPFQNGLGHPSSSQSSVSEQGKSKYPTPASYLSPPPTTQSMPQIQITAPENRPIDYQIGKNSSDTMPKFAKYPEDIETYENMITSPYANGYDDLKSHGEYVGYNDGKYRNDL